MKEACNEQGKEQAKTECKEETSTQPEGKKTSKERKRLRRIKYVVSEVEPADRLW
jgi:hypothetical protein